MKHEIAPVVVEGEIPTRNQIILPVVLLVGLSYFSRLDCDGEWCFGHGSSYQARIGSIVSPYHALVRFLVPLFCMFQLCRDRWKQRLEKGLPGILQS